MTVTQDQKKLLQSTANVLKDNGKEIMSKFYTALFSEHPEYRSYFNQTNQETGKQPEAMAETIYHFVQYLDNLDAMKPQMSRLSSKHRAVGVKPELYPTLGKYLVGAITQALGSKATPDVVAAWNALYSQMAATFIEREKKLYAELGDNEADRGFVSFAITKKDVIADGPTYLVTLERKDGGKLWNYTPGQYITIRIEKNGTQHQGHYTLVEPSNGKNYTIAFKQGKKTDQNIIVNDEIASNRQVGGTVLVSGPAGSFGANEDAKSNLFIGGGIGIASLMAIINQLIQQNKASSVSVVQCVRAQGDAAFGEQLRKQVPQGQYVLLTEKETISKSHLEDKVKSDTQVYISGSESFLALVEKALAGFNLPKSQIHIKSIEPTLGLLKAISAKH